MQIQNKVLKIIENIGMKPKKAAEAMGVSYQAFRNKKAGICDKFTEDNLKNLKAFIKAQARKI